MCVAFVFMYLGAMYVCLKHTRSTYIYVFAMYVCLKHTRSTYIYVFRHYFGSKSDQNLMLFNDLRVAVLFIVAMACVSR